MEQFAVMFTEYADIICTALGVATVVTTGTTLHKLKKLEKGLYGTREEAKIVQPKEQKAVAEQVSGERSGETPVTTNYSREQEKLLDAVLGEVFP